VKTQAAFLVLFLGLIVSGCSFSLQKASSTEDLAGADSTLNESEVPSYSNIRSQILQPHCLSCHGREAPILLTFDQVKSNLAAIERTVLQEYSMPQSGPLSSAKQALLRDWIAAGAPETVVTSRPASDSAPVTTPVLSGPSRPVRFAALKEQVLDVACNSCHFPGNEEGLSPLTTHAEVLEVGGSLWGFTILEASMPPSDVPGVEPLSALQKDLISLWFADGMQE
jgi:hypothetical protein